MERLLVPDGMPVREGQPLATLASPALQLDILTREATIASQPGTVSGDDLTLRRGTLDRAAQTASADYDLIRARDLPVQRQLHDQGFVSEAGVASAREQAGQVGSEGRWKLTTDVDEYYPGRVRVGQRARGDRLQPADGDEGRRRAERGSRLRRSRFRAHLRLPMVAGDLGRALASPANVVLTRDTARKYFGDADPIGRTMAITVRSVPRLFRVAAITASLPHDTDLSFGMLARLVVTEDKGSPSYRADHEWNYFDPAAVPGVARDIQTVADRHAADGTPGSPGTVVRTRIQPLADGHPDEPGARPALATIGIVGVLTLLIAIVNYVNLATARAGLRAREVAMRKALGADRGTLFRHYALEALAMTAVAAVCGLALAEAAMPIVDLASRSASPMSAVTACWRRRHRRRRAGRRARARGPRRRAVRDRHLRAHRSRPSSRSPVRPRACSPRRAATTGSPTHGWRSTRWHGAPPGSRASSTATRVQPLALDRAGASSGAAWVDELARSFRAMPQADCVTLDVSLSPGGLSIEADAALLGQVPLNLMKNGAEAAAAADRPRVAVTIARGDAGRTAMSVEDNGAGVPAGLEDDIFLPFFTTKRGGTGVGLSFARQIATLHGGGIGVARPAAGGACFTLVL